MRKGLALWLGLVLLLAACRGQASLTLATTTSTYDSGLLDDLLPPFEQAHNVKVKVVAVGSGQALALGERGDAEVLLVHSPQAEEAFMANGYGSLRLPVMYNDFVLVGPPADPAQVVIAASAGNAFRQVAAAGALFASRGDSSGTHTKEKDVWAAAGITPQGPWYLSLGQGMGETLLLASEKGAYTLSDWGTYLALQDKLPLTILSQGDPLLANPYHVILVNPTRHPSVKADLALSLANYLTSLKTQEQIGQFGQARYGQPLFFPDSPAWREAQQER